MRYEYIKNWRYGMRIYYRVFALILLGFFLMGQFGCLSCQDTVKPVVSIIFPTNGSTVSGTVTIQASASDNVGILKVEFYIDSNKVGEDTSSPYEYSWNTTIVDNGTHTTQAKAYDPTGNLGVSPIVTVNVDNVPMNVLIDDVHQNVYNFDGYGVEIYWATLISKLQDMGYTVRLASEAGFSPSISDYNIIFLPAPVSPYSDTETQALLGFVNAGGKLIILGEWYRYSGNINPNLNTLSNALGIGITFNKDAVYDDTNNYGAHNYWPLISDFVPHPTTSNVTTVVYVFGCSLSVQSPATPIAYASLSAYTRISEVNSSKMNNMGIGLNVPGIKSKDGNIIVAAVAEIGMSKVIAIGDVGLFCDDPAGFNGGIAYISLLNNMRFLENIINW